MMIAVASQEKEEKVTIVQAKKWCKTFTKVPRSLQVYPPKRTTSGKSEIQEDFDNVQE